MAVRLGFFFLYFLPGLLWANGEAIYQERCLACHSLAYFERDHVSFLSALSKEQAEAWFGRLPPDLSLVGQYRGRAWLVAYLNGFYPHKKAIWGVDNSVFPGTKMPAPFTDLDLKSRSKMIEEVADFLVLVADPSIQERHRLGPWVILYFILLIGTLGFLYREIWKA